MGVPTVLDLTGPLAVFHNANRVMERLRAADHPAYRTEVIAGSAGRVDSWQGLGVFADCSFAEVTQPISRRSRPSTSRSASCRNGFSSISPPPAGNEPAVQATYAPGLGIERAP
jgi:hypothetical protein